MQNKIERRAPGFALRRTSTVLLLQFETLLMDKKRKHNCELVASTTTRRLMIDRVGLQNNDLKRRHQSCCSCKVPKRKNPLQSPISPTKLLLLLNGNIIESCLPVVTWPPATDLVDCYYASAWCSSCKDFFELPFKVAEQLEINHRKTSQISAGIGSFQCRRMQL